MDYKSKAINFRIANPKERSLYVVLFGICNPEHIRLLFGICNPELNIFGFLIQHTNNFPDQKLNQIHNNPVVTQIVDEPEDHLYSSARNYCDISGLINVELIDM